jgi:hypothetical protein
MTASAEQAVTPNTAEIRHDLEYMVARWGELSTPAVFEIRAFKEGAQPQTAKFAPDWIDDAVEWCESMNGLGYNIYAVRNPIRHDVTGSASDADILASFFLWADCDDQNSAQNVRRFDGPKYSAAIVTGKTPETRVHIYWQLEDPITDLSAWRDMQQRIAAHFNSDSTVVNPSRIMRVGGTVSYPAKHKVERGYAKEVTTIRTQYDDDREPVTLDQMGRVFAAAPAPAQNTLRIDTGGFEAPLDRERMAIQAMQGNDWHNAIIRLVASYVSKGLADPEIHALTQPLTLAGYTAEDTAREVQTAIDGARAKGWTPEPKYAEPPAIATTSEAQPAGLEWFDDIQPVLADSYIIKGVLAQETMSVVYGPSNSGKTFFALDVAYHAAIGAQWRNKRVCQTAVLYLAAEGGRGVANRIAALRAETGVCEVPFALRRAGMDLLQSEADLNTVLTLAQEVKARAPDAPLMIVIDTLSRVMAGGDENSAADMTALIRNIDALRAATQAHIMLVHHTGKDTARGARGHSSLRAATDTEIEVQTTDDEDGAQHRAAMVTKQRDYAGSDSFAFTLKSVTLGHDQDGDEVTSCVVESANSEDFIAAKKSKKGLGGNQKIVAEAFDQMVAEGLAQPNPGGVGMPEPGQFWAVETEALREICMGKMTSNSPRHAFNHAVRALSESRGIFVTGKSMIWRVDRRIR